LTFYEVTIQDKNQNATLVFDYTGSGIVEFSKLLDWARNSFLEGKIFNSPDCSTCNRLGIFVLGNTALFHKFEVSIEAIKELRKVNPPSSEELVTGDLAIAETTEIETYLNTEKAEFTIYFSEG
jgi:hypothetical protein